MKRAYLLAIACLLTGAVWAQKPGKWQSLFDGKSLKGWHSYQQGGGVKGWMVMGGALMTHGGSGDLVSNDQFEDFELEFEFRVAPKGNSGVMYKVIEDAKNPTYYSGPEYQVVDDEGYPPFNDGGKMVRLNDRQKTGANYDMHAPAKNVAKSAGQWNKGRIVVKDNHVEHWLNGEKVVEYEYGSDDWKATVAKSKFANWPYAQPHTRGHIALQDHGDEAWYRNIRIRTL